MKTIFVVGSVNTDLGIMTPYMPASGETLAGSGFFTAHGGKGANQAVAAARLGGKVVLCACIGDDAFGDEALASFKADGIDTSFVRRVPKTPTGTAVIILCKGDNRIILDKGANAALSEEDVDKALASAKPGDILLTQLENPIDVIGYALRKGKEKGMYVICNPAPADAAIAPYVRYCDLLTPNETETELLGGRETLSKLGVRLCITLGSKGYELDGQTYPCPKIKPVDTTAAGDTFCGGLCARLSLGDSLTDAASFGSRAASLACTKMGAQPSVPTAEEVRKWNPEL